MKKIVITIISIVLLITVSALCYNSSKKENAEAYLRVHIRANSNSQVDQSVKMQVKASVVDFLTPKLTAGDSFEKAYEIIEDNLDEIEKVTDKVLEDNGFCYKSKAKLNEEYFPTRSYGELTLTDGFYDALIIELGEAEGNNWWCVVYPPLCFIGAEGSDTNNIKYKSKLYEIVQNFFD